MAAPAWAMDGLIGAGGRASSAGASWAEEPSRARRRPHRRGPRAQRRSDARRRRRPAAHGRAERRLMRRSRLSAGTWLALSAGVLAVATLVAIGAALIASHQLTQARGRVVDRVDVASNTAAGALQRDGQPGDRRARLRARRRGAVPRPLPRGRRERRAAPSASSTRWRRPTMRGRLRRRPGGGAARASPPGESGYARPTIERHPPVRRGAGSRTPPSRRARRASTRVRAARRPPAGRSAGRPRRRARRPGQRGSVAHAGAGLRGDPAGAGAGWPSR